MKKLKLIPLLSLIFLFNVASTCSKDDDTNNLSSELQQKIINTASAGTWKVTLFQENGVDHTSYFTGFDFTFGPNSVLTATNPNNTYKGSWSVTTDERSNDDNPNDDVDFNIAFTAPSTFSELTEDWQVVEINTTKIKLTHVSGGNGGTDFLTIERN
jgi:hypothetical protein